MIDFALSPHKSILPLIFTRKLFSAIEVLQVNGIQKADQGQTRDIESKIILN